MSDPLSILLGTGDGGTSTGSAPATPSKTRISSRPPPYVRPPASPGGTGSQTRTAGAAAGGSIQAAVDARITTYSGPGQVEQFPNGANQQYTSIVRSQSPLAPRPPLPGQLQRPVSPIQWNQSGGGDQSQNTPSSAGFAQQQQQAGPSAGTFSPTSPNAWASSPESASGQAGGSSHHSHNRAYNHNIPAPVPNPLPVPQPVSGLGGPSRPLHSPGVPRSPIAESPTRSILSQAGSSAQNGYTQQQQQQAKVPPYVRIRVTGIDRAKKELGIKMDAQTNIPTYHRRQSPIFERTYNEFSLLHGALSANHPETILPALPLPQTSATNEEEEDRFLKGVFQKFMDRITRDRFLIQDDELRSFIDADFGYTPLTKAKKLKSSSAGFLSRSSSKPLVGEDGEPDFLVTSKVHSAALETALSETCKSLEKVLKHQTTCASSYAELATTLASFSTTETHQPLTDGMKGLAEAMTHIAQLETGQANATALVLGDSLAYEAVEARSAKDALLQRQYNIDELRNAIKTTINKRRTIEKLKASGNIKPERVNEALDDLEEAAKHEQNLQHRVEAISRNLRPALQTHLRTMNGDMLSIALGQARTMLAYESRKLQIYDGIHAKIAKIPERGSTDQSAIYYHQPQAEAGTSTGGGSASTPTVSSVPSAPSTMPHAANMSPSSSHQTHGSASALDQSMAQSKFLATQAAIQAEMQAQREREERQRAQFAQARAYQHQKQASLGRASAVNPTAPTTAAAAATPQPPNSASIASGSGSALGLPTSPKAARQTSPQPQSPLHSAAASQAAASTTTHLIAPRTSSMSQSMFIPPSQAQSGVPPSSPSTAARAVPQSPFRLQRSSSITHSPSSGVDPLSPGGALADPTSVRHTGPTPGMYQPPSQQQQQYLPQQQQQYQRQPERPAGPHPNGNMTQSVFLPGRSAQPGFRPAQQNIADERKRADARKAASFLAGAF